jgi:hypothetical protein
VNVIGTTLQCVVEVLMSIIDGAIMAQLLGIEGSGEGCGTHIIKAGIYILHLELDFQMVVGKCDFSSLFF